MRKMALGFGLATAGMVFMASHVLAQTGSSSTGSTSSGNSAVGESSGSSTTSTTSDTSTTKSAALQGKVEKFDRSQKTLRLSGSDKTLHVDSSTTVMRSGLSGTLDDIKEGDEVRASYSGSENAINVKTIDIIASRSTGMGTANPAPPSSSAGDSATGTSK